LTKWLSIDDPPRVTLPRFIARLTFNTLANVNHVNLLKLIRSGEMFHEKTGWAKCGHETSYLTKDDASFEPEMCDACLKKFAGDRKRKFAEGYREPTLAENEKIVMADCGHLGEAVMVDGRRIEPKECLDCFAARHRRDYPLEPETWEALAMLSNLIDNGINGDENRP